MRRRLEIFDIRKQMLKRNRDFGVPNPKFLSPPYGGGRVYCFVLTEKHTIPYRALQKVSYETFFFREALRVVGLLPKFQGCFCMSARVSLRVFGRVRTFRMILGHFPEG